MTPANRTIGLIILAALVAGGTALLAQNRRAHTALKAEPIMLVPATRTITGNAVQFERSAGRWVVRSNAIPNHAVGVFPNRGNPHKIYPQNLELRFTASPTPAAQATSARDWIFGIANSGVAFDPFTAEYWQGDRQSGWNYDALGGAIGLGLDENSAHVQPSGAYHYHGIPRGLLEVAGYSQTRHSPLIGYAADGFPIFALTGSVDGRIMQMTSSYRLKTGQRPGGSGPSGTHDGAFVEDWMYLEGTGTLDACNGAFTVSADFPNGTYAYFLTDAFPGVPRCFTGTPDPSFNKRRRLRQR